MDFLIGEELQMLQDTTRRLIARDYTFARREQIRTTADGWSRETWRQLAELGLLALIVPDELGGVGAGSVGAMLVSQAIGAGLLLEPFHASAIAATHALVEIADRAQRERWLDPLIAGASIAALAHEEPHDSSELLDVRTQATRDGDGWRISGSKCAIYHGDAADLLLVSARVDKSNEIALFALRADAAGIHRRAYATVDDQRAADIELQSVRVDADSRLGDNVRTQIQATLDFSLAALCAEALGALDSIFAATIEYSRNRRQFGVAIGSFQALQHRMTDMYMQVEQARSMTYLAACRCTSTDATARAAAVSAAKVAIGQAARFVGQQAVQIHGGMGMTDELDVSHYFKRLTAFELRGGSTDWHLREYARHLETA